MKICRPQSTRRRRHAIAAALFALFGCGQPGGTGTSTPSSPTDPALSFDASLQVLDENGSPLPTATYALEDALGASASGNPARATRGVDGQGRFRLPGLVGPVLVTITAPGFLDEPVIVDRTLAATETHVRLRAAEGAGGRRRIVLHFGGDTMIGRRFIEPTSDITARVIPGDGGASARAVGSAIAPLFRLSHFRSVNLETVVGDFDASEAYPKKRFLLQSPPETVDLLDALGINFCTLGNNHARDWLDAGVQSTVNALDAVDIGHAGGGATSADAAEPLVMDVHGYRIGLLSYTSVNGDVVNDSLPLNSAAVPSPLASSEAWQYDMRSFGYSGIAVTIPTAARRIGEFWSLFETVEDLASAAGELETLWAGAVDVYPELQDWVARRGHGGANPYVSSTIDDDVASLRSRGCDLVIVQFHGGFQFFEVKSVNLESAAHRAIEVGADIVVCHHPHVLQGFEWYQGKLVAYSLGNFVFDQDFLSTFNSVVLRVIFEESTLLEARVLPVVLERYKPRPLAGAAAANTTQILHERSVLPFRSERIGSGVRTVLRDSPPGVVPAALRLERNTGVIEEGPSDVETVVATANDHAIVDLAPPALTRSRGPGGATLVGADVGRDLFRWGDFEDDMADGEVRGGPHWLVNDTFKRIEVLSTAPSGRRCLRLSRTATSTQRAVVRPVARIPMVSHRLFEESGGTVTPLDGAATYTLRMKARLSGPGQPFARFDVYHFDDSNPTEDPESSLIRSQEVSLSVAADDRWHDLVLDIASTTFRPAGDLDANVVLLNLGLAPRSGATVFRADDVQFLEWRAAASVPDGFYALDAVRLPAAGDGITLERTTD